MCANTDKLKLLLTGEIKMKIENAEQALVEILNKALEVGDFMTEQAPLVVQELLLYKTITHFLGFVFLSSLMFLSVKLFRWSELKSTDSGDIYRIYQFSSAVVFIIAALGAIHDIASFIKVIIAPRLYLLEYAAELVK